MLLLKTRELIDAKAQSENKRISLEEVAREIHISAKTVRAAYYGTDSFTGRQLEQWCDYLNCEPAAILVYQKDQP